MSVAGLAIGGAIASGLAGLADTGVNWYLTEKTNRQNEALMRESWAREDNAVQRRVADLKAAGLSPTLAAGSAAASSGPISLNSPKLNTSSAIQNALSTASAVESVKNLKLQNENLKKQGEILDLNGIYYGYPDWAVAGIRMFGLEQFKDMIRSVGGNLFGLFTDSDSDSFTSPQVYTPSNGVPWKRPDLSTDLKIKKKDVKNVPVAGSDNESSKKALDVLGVDTSTFTKPESNPQSFGVFSSDFKKDAEFFVKTMIKDKMVSTNNLDLLSHQLSVRYGYKESDIRSYITDLVRELR